MAKSPLPMSSVEADETKTPQAVYKLPLGSRQNAVLGHRHSILPPSSSINPVAQPNQATPPPCHVIEELLMDRQSELDLQRLSRYEALEATKKWTQDHAYTVPLSVSKWRKKRPVLGSIADGEFGAKAAQILAEKTQRGPEEPQESTNVALLVHWPQKFFQSWFTEEVIAKLQAFIQSANDKHVPILYNTTRIGPEVDPAPSTNVFMNALKKVPQDYAELFAFIPALEPTQFDAIVHTTQGLGAFSEGYLAMELKTMGIDTLVLVGASASHSVPSTYMEACNEGFSVVVIEDLCVDPYPEVYETLMSRIFQYQAEVMMSEDWDNGLWLRGRFDKRVCGSDAIARRTWFADRRKKIHTEKTVAEEVTRTHVDEASSSEGSFEFLH